MLEHLQHPIQLLISHQHRGAGRYFTGAQMFAVPAACRIAMMWVSWVQLGLILVHELIKKIILAPLHGSVEECAQ